MESVNFLCSIQTPQGFPAVFALYRSHFGAVAKASGIFRLLFDTFLSRPFSFDLPTPCLSAVPSGCRKPFQNADLPETGKPCSKLSIRLEDLVRGFADFQHKVPGKRKDPRSSREHTATGTLSPTDFPATIRKSTASLNHSAAQTVSSRESCGRIKAFPCLMPTGMVK